MIPALFCRWTWPEFSFICGAGYVDNSEINVYYRYINYIIVTIDMITNLHKTDTKRTTHLRNLTHFADGLCCLSQEHQLAMKWTQKMRNTRPANRHGTAAKRNKACQWIKEREILKIIINTLARKWLDQFFKFRTFCEPHNKKHLEQVSRAKFIAELQNILPLFIISLNNKIAYCVHN